MDLVTTIMFVPFGEESAKQIFLDKLEDISGGSWTHAEIQKGVYWKHVRHAGRVWMKEDNRFTVESDDEEDEGMLLGAFLNWVGRHANREIWSANVIFGEVHV